ELPRPKLQALGAPLGSLPLIQNSGSLAKKGFPEHFDAVVMNPPYLSTRTMDDTTADFLKKHFARSSGDLYTAFIELALSLLEDGGKLSTIVQQSFLSISRYRDFRLTLLEEGSLISCIQLGTGAFPSRPGEKVNNAILTIEKASKRKHFNYLRLEGKKAHRQVRQLGLSQHPGATIDHRTASALIANLSGQPFAFHCPPDVAALFTKHQALADCHDDFVLTNGLFTCDNKRFVKLTAELTEEERPIYVPYDKGGGAKWYHRTPHSLFWQDKGQAIRDYRVSRGQSRSLPGEAHYFQAGLTYSYIGTKGFKARLLSPGAIFDIASSAVFSRRYDLNFLLAFFNSALVVYLLSILNPTVNFQIGDLRKLPFKAPTPDLEKALAALASRAVELVTQLDMDNLSREQVAAIVAAEGLLQQQINNLIFDHYQVGSEARRIILSETWVKHSQKLNR
ncbi:MAG: N-6 DNA methylase, partial [Cyanobacteria bacterium REEB67]|nr:N-6 DNA methylase [Cyanobacteria bacterium REEB67]